MRRLLSVLLLAAAMALGTWVAWWMVPVIGALWSLIRSPRDQAAESPSRPGILRVAVAAALGWTFWLVLDGLSGHGALARLGGRLGAVMHLPFPALLAVTLLFPALLAASAAILGHGFAAALPPRPEGTR
jgi:hypothetical protein